MCWLASKVLGDAPSTIVAKRVKPLGVWLPELAARCPWETPVPDSRRWGEWMLPLRAAMRQSPASTDYAGPKQQKLGQTCLNDYGLPASPTEAAIFITKIWVHSVKRRLLREVGERKRGS
jgi:hypothetical protein